MEVHCVARAETCCTLRHRPRTIRLDVKHNRESLHGLQCDALSKRVKSLSCALDAADEARPGRGGSARVSRSSLTTSKTTFCMGVGTYSRCASHPQARPSGRNVYECTPAVWRSTCWLLRPSCLAYLDACAASEHEKPIGDWRSWCRRGPCCKGLNSDPRRKAEDRPASMTDS